MLATLMVVVGSVQKRYEVLMSLLASSPLESCFLCRVVAVVVYLGSSVATGEWLSLRIV